MQDTFEIQLKAAERRGITRVREPVTVGVSFPKGAVFSPADLELCDPEERAVLSQTTVTVRWSDGSIKWGLIDFQMDVAGKEAATYVLRRKRGERKKTETAGIRVEESSGHLVVHTGTATFHVNRTVFVPFDQVRLGSEELLAEGRNGLELIDDKGIHYLPYIDDMSVQLAGPVRTTVRFRGRFRSQDNSCLAEFMAALNFFVNHSTIETELTIHNPKAAQHPRELWDLGDQGSIYFKDLSLYTSLKEEEPACAEWMTSSSQKSEVHTGRLEIYQDSSGGANWNSRNHINRHGKVTTSFCGYRVTVNGVRKEQGDRAEPIIAVRNRYGVAVASIKGFWQNFPKALESDQHGMIVRLFPHQSSDQYELQGGEQKTHVVFLSYGRSVDTLLWVHDRLRPCLDSSWCARSKAVSYLHPMSARGEMSEALIQAERLVTSAVIGDHTFFSRREIIDEYGWRHFGDLYADHESVQHSGPTPLIAHYNNQYDVIYGSLIQYLRTGNHQWFKLADELAQHVIDIDIYHTKQDRLALNGGLFWHTDHYTDAGTATHRALTKLSPQAQASSHYGGGPACEHNYTSGLLLYYWMTGDIKARDAVLTLADWVVNMDNGSRRRLGFLDPRPTGYCSATAERSYHGPGRGAGNSINALLDANQLVPTSVYLEKAEELIRRCIHPCDDIEHRRLEDVELRWSYTVFLQVLAKYLDFKAEVGQLDFMYGYAQESLLHYARWMIVHEVPFKTILHKVTLPTETWPAQDIRKANVFHLAAKHADGSERTALQQKAAFFFDACINDLLSFKTHMLTRPIVILMANAYVHPYFIVHNNEVAPHPTERYKYGKPIRFTPQFDELYKARDLVQTIVRTAQSFRRCVWGDRER